MTGHPALSPCSTGGACPVSERVPEVVRGMRERDGRCTGCGRSVTAPTISAPEGAPADVAASRGSEPTTSGAESALVPCGRQAGKTTRAAGETENILRATSTEGLVDAVIQLTHQIHGCLDGKHDARAADLRAQRALVKAEIVRRAS